MEGICGVFRPELLAEWLSKVGPAIAGFVAVGLFVMSRWYARQDLKAKRKVLSVMVVANIREALQFADGLRVAFELSREKWEPHVPQWALQIPGSESLLGLQGELLGVADHGDETVPEFIEACRRYRCSIDGLASLARSPSNSPIYGAAVYDAKIDVESALGEVRRTGEAAVAHLQDACCSDAVRVSGLLDVRGSH